MGLRTPEEYLASLRDGRRVYFNGESVADVTAHPIIGRGVAHAAADFSFAWDPLHRALATAEVFGETSSAFYAAPRAVADLRRRAQLIEASTRHGHTIVPLVKEIGSDAIFALVRLAAALDQTDGSLGAKVDALWRRAAAGDLALAVAQTDAKGDRSLGPRDQPDPDAYLRIVDRTPDGIVVRGAKMHTSGSAIVVPHGVSPSDRESDSGIAFLSGRSSLASTPRRPSTSWRNNVVSSVRVGIRFSMRLSS